MKVLYTAKGRATGGRDGRATSLAGFPDLQLKPPPALGGPSDVEATNPEELFALGYAACFLSALSLIARQQKISAAQLQKKAGKRLPVIIDEAHGLSAKGRTKYDAPEIDGSVHIQSRRPLRTGDIVTVKIDRADAYDLYGQAV